MSRFKAPDGQRSRIPVASAPAPKRKKTSAVTPDTAFGLAGLMWNDTRIKAQKAWNQVPGVIGSAGQAKVGGADTGLDYTHVELMSKVDLVVDFTLTGQPNICSYFFGQPTDQELAMSLGAPAADLDLTGKVHGLAETLPRI